MRKLIKRSVTRRLLPRWTVLGCVATAKGVSPYCAPLWLRAPSRHELTWRCAFQAVGGQNAADAVLQGGGLARRWEQRGHLLSAQRCLLERDAEGQATMSGGPPSLDLSEREAGGRWSGILTSVCAEARTAQPMSISTKELSDVHNQKKHKNPFADKNSGWPSHR